MSIELKTSTQENVQEIKVAALRQEIIDSVLARGLIAGINLSRNSQWYFSSGDSESNEHVYGNVLHPVSHYKFYYGNDSADSKQMLQRDLEYSLYASFDSILPVMMERRDEGTPWTHLKHPKRTLPYKNRPLLEKRLSSWFLVAAKTGGLSVKFGENQMRLKLPIVVEQLINLRYITRDLFGQAFDSVKVNAPKSAQNMSPKEILRETINQYLKMSGSHYFDPGVFDNFIQEL